MRLYHNPRCSKSREALVLLQAAGVQAEIVEYLKQPPSLDELRALQGRLGVPVRDMLRSGEAAYETLQLGRAELDDEALLQALSRHPELLQRPIVDDGRRALIARPSALIQAWL